jgi:Concanavalin A-like lectin/glucanases superfamily
MSSSGFSVIRRHSSDATGIRIKELTQELARQRSQISGSQLETDDVRSQGRMDHSTIKINDERLKFIDLLSNDPSINYEFPQEPDFNFLKVWFMLDHLGTRMRDMSGFGNDAIIQGHPTLRRANLIMGFGSTDLAGGTPTMLFNSGTDVVSQRNGEYIYIIDNPSVQFTLFPTGFSIAFRFNCLDFSNHISLDGLTFGRRFAAKTDNATNGWNLIVYPTNTAGTNGGVEFQVVHNNVTYKRRTTGYNINTWYQVIITYDPNAGSTNAARIKIYTAGTENSLDGTATLILPTQTNLRIGARDFETGFFYGYIHDFRLYMGKVLTTTEVTNLNQNEVTIDNIPKRQVFILQHALFGLT